MKILRISLKNIASLSGIHTVDFTSEPLASTGLFAICGPTGSGKSTLLDAMCVSLYDTTPRLSFRAQVAAIQDAGGEISQTDVRNLLRRGAGDGFTEVAFQGIDGQNYTSRWSVRRAHRNPSGALQSTNIALFEGNLSPGANGVVVRAGGKGEVLAAIKEKVGLSFEQFTKAVLLAQNDFASFLKARDSDRAEILQTLTGTTRFEGISIEVFNRAGSEEQAIKELESQLSGSEPLAEEDRSLLEIELGSAELLLADTNKKMGERSLHKQWFDHRDELLSHLDGARKHFSNASADAAAAESRRVELARTEKVSAEARLVRDRELQTQNGLKNAEQLEKEASEELGRRQQALDHACKELAAETGAHEAAEEALTKADPQLRAARALDVRLGPLTKQKNDAQSLSDEAFSELEEAVRAKCEKTAERDNAAGERGRLAAEVSGLRHWAPFVGDRVAWTDRLQQAVRVASDNSKRAAVLKKAESTLAKAQRAEAEAATSATQVSGQVGSLEGEINEIREELQRIDLPQIQNERRGADAALAALLALQLHLQKLETASHEKGVLVHEIGLLEQQLAEGRAREEALKSKLVPEARLVWEATQRAVEIAEAAVCEAAAGLREKLQPGSECPVCGGTDHPYAAHVPSEEQLSLRALRQEARQRDQASRSLSAELAGLSGTFQNLEAQFGTKKRRLSDLEENLKELRAYEPVHPSAAGIWVLDEIARGVELEKYVGALQVQRERLEQAEKSGESLSAKLSKRAKEKDSAQTQLQDLTSHLADCSKAVAVADGERVAALERKALGETAFGDCIKALRPLWAEVPSLEGEFHESMEAFAERFAQETDALASYGERDAIQAGLEKQAEAGLVQLAARVALAQGNVEKSRSRLDEASVAQREVVTQRQQLFDGVAADVVEELLKSAVASCAQKKKAAQAAKESADQAVAGAKEKLNGCAAEVGRLTTGLQESSIDMDGWLGGFARDTGTALCRADLDVLLKRDLAWMDRERRALSNLEIALAKSSAALQEHENGLAAHDEIRPTPDERETVFADIPRLEGERKQKAGEVDQLRAKILNDNTRRSGSEELRRRIAEQNERARPWRDLNALIGSSDGAKFRNIAQRRTLDILLRYANEQLQRLSSRYKLERIPQSLNLLVVDQHMADEKRTVHSLSGGETFLVSLALALGLASLTSNRLQIESLFIDEGFGSLDPDTLSTATHALQSLQAQGRKVGVISHVSEMADAIPVQIRVVKGKGGSSRIHVPGAQEV